VTTLRTLRAPLACAGLAVLAAAFALPSPAEARRSEPKVNPYAAIAPVQAPPPPADGAIFHASQGYAPLTSGARAAMVGDLVTIVLVEKTQATKTNTANTARTSNVGLTPPTTGPLSFFQASDASAGGNSTFKGTGGATQANQLSGAVTVTVAQVLPNGNLVVQGEKNLTLNRGQEFVRIKGIVRPTDIDGYNQVLSTRVADAEITYSGKGEIARASSQGWLGRFFSRVSPF
jgi:flagellar L-ring protein FlgH